MRWYFYDDIQVQRRRYLLVRWRAVLLGQLEGDLGADQLVRQLLDLLLDWYKATRHRNRNSYLVLLDLQFLRSEEHTSELQSQ